MKKTISLILVLCVVLSLAACGGTTGYGVSAIQVLVEQDYSIAFRNNDTVYHYVTAAISVLAAEGRVDELSTKWLGGRVIEFPKDAEALSRLQPPQPQDLIIGLDPNSFPMAYASNDSYWGFDVELAIAVCERLGWTLKMQPIEKENVYIELSSGNIDCAWGGVALNQTEIDEGKYTQFGPYIHNDIVIAGRNGGTAWNKLKLSGKRMVMCSTPEALEALNTDERLLKRLGQITRLAGGTTECFQYLYSGKCDVVLTDSTALQYFNCH